MKQPKILIVDDMSTMRRIVIHIIKSLGYINFREAEDGESALKVLKSEKIDIILSDWNMPGMNGLEFLQAVRADPAICHIPFLMVTAEAKDENVRKAHAEGVTDYIIKPFKAPTIELKFKKYLAEETEAATAIEVKTLSHESIAVYEGNINAA